MQEAWSSQRTQLYSYVTLMKYQQMKLIKTPPFTNASKLQNTQGLRKTHGTEQINNMLLFMTQRAHGEMAELPTLLCDTGIPSRMPSDHSVDTAMLIPKFIL